MDGGRIVAEELKRQGVEVVFTLCGGHIMPIYEGCLDLGIKVVDVRHEQAAAMAADGWARVTGKPGVALVTAGPGVTNAVTGMANAWKAGSPTVVLGGMAELTRFDQGPLQDMHHVDMVRPITKWARGVFQANRLGEYTRTAIREAAAPPSGPTFLEVPWDVLFDDATPEDKGSGRPTRPLSAPAPDLLDEAARALVTAERPVIVAGSGLRWSNAEGALQRFADAAEAPVYLNGLARGALPPTHPRFMSFSRSKALREADVVLNLGGEWDFRLGFGEGLADGAVVLHAETDAARAGAVRAYGVPLVGDVGLTTLALLDRLKGQATKVDKAWLQGLREKEQAKRADLDEGLQSDQSPVHALRLAAEVSKFVDEDTIVIGDGGNIVALGAKVIPQPAVGSWMDPGPFGTLGVGLPFAMAAKLAKPDAKVIVYMGDGSVGLNGFEIDTLVRHGLPVTIVVGNDGAWSQIRQPQVAFYGEERAVATGLGWGTRYDKFCESLGGRGWLVEHPKEIGPCLEESLACGTVGLVNVLVDAETNQGSGKAM